MRGSSFRCGVALAALVLGSFAAVAPAQAELIVVSSKADGYDRGRILQNEETLSLADGQSVRVMTPSGATRDIPGPIETQVAELSGARDSMSDGFRRLAAYLGGDARDETSTLATRSADILFYVSGTPFSDKGGSYCYASSRKVKLERRDSAGAVEATVTGGAQRASVAFDNGEKSVKWPARVRSGQKYTVALTPGGSAEVTLFSIGRISEDRLIGALAEKGCFAQVEQFLTGGNSFSGG